MRPIKRKDPPKALLSTLGLGKGKLKGHRNEKTKRGFFKIGSSRINEESCKKQLVFVRGNTSLLSKIERRNVPKTINPPPTTAATSNFPLPAEKLVTNEAEYESDLSEAEFEKKPSTKVNSSAPLVVSLNNDTIVTNEAEYENDWSDGPCFPLPAKIQPNQTKSNPAETEFEKNPLKKILRRKLINSGKEHQYYISKTPQQQRRHCVFT
jgi:hypothetical protein